MMESELERVHGPQVDKHVAKPDGPTPDSLAKLATAIKDITGCDHVTILALNQSGATARRVFSSAPEIFPTFGTKPVPKGKWAAHILEAQEPKLFDGADEIRAVFDDHEHILSHHIHAIFNIPVVCDAHCRGSVNCLYASNPAPKHSQRMADSVVGLLGDAEFLRM
jgi:transcriptional regulator with GAF, ATPase, and Fis domain